MAEQTTGQACSIPLWVILAVPLGLLAALVILFDLCWPALW